MSFLKVATLGIRTAGISHLQITLHYFSYHSSAGALLYFLHRAKLAYVPPKRELHQIFIDHIYLRK